MVSHVLFFLISRFFKALQNLVANSESREERTRKWVFKGQADKPGGGIESKSKLLPGGVSNPTSRLPHFQGFFSSWIIRTGLSNSTTCEARQCGVLSLGVWWLGCCQDREEQVSSWCPAGFWMPPFSLEDFPGDVTSESCQGARFWVGSFLNHSPWLCFSLIWGLSSSPAACLLLVYFRFPTRLYLPSSVYFLYHLSWGRGLSWSLSQVLIPYKPLVLGTHGPPPPTLPCFTHFLGSPHSQHVSYPPCWLPNCACLLVAHSCLTLCNPRNCTHRAPLSMWFSRQVYWNGLPFHLLGIFPIQGSNLCLLCWHLDFFPLSHLGSLAPKDNRPHFMIHILNCSVSLWNVPLLRVCTLRLKLCDQSKKVISLYLCFLIISGINTPSTGCEDLLDNNSFSNLVTGVALHPVSVTIIITCYMLVLFILYFTCPVFDFLFIYFFASKHSVL